MRKKKAIPENRNRLENRLFGAGLKMGSLMAEAISLTQFHVSAIQIQDHKSVATLVPKVTPQDKQISFQGKV